MRVIERFYKFLINFLDGSLSVVNFSILITILL